MLKETPHPTSVTTVHKRLLDWYRRHGRDLPWRRTRDPYAILVSEIMLQQTQVERVIPKYQEFLAAFPTIASLAAASRSEVIRRWAPLGYNLRAVRLHEIARQVVERFDGRLPESAESLQQLKGLGPYTAGAVACFGFGERTPILDTNVRRVLGRVFDGVDLGRTPADERRGWQIAADVLPERDYYDWNQALMDLGATVCTARKPACLVCPLREQCGYVNDRAIAPAGIGAVEAPYLAVTSGRRVAEQRTGYRTAPFSGSNRYYRGRIVNALRSAPADVGLGAQTLGEIVRPGFREGDLPWLLSLLEGLERDGLVTLDRTGDSITARLPH